MRTLMSCARRAGPVRPLIFAGGLLGAFYAYWLTHGTAAAEQPKVLATPVHDVIDRAPLQTAVFAGGCFWGTQGIFQHVTGIVSTKAGYAGGTAETATYELTETGTTQHAEAVQIVYDSRKITYGKLLQVFFSVAHDPTQLNKQGSDVGTQYRSAIFPQTPDQAKVAKSYIEQLDADKSFQSKIVTTIEPGKAFFAAEAFHQDYLVHNPTQPYVAFVEQPKVDALNKLFPKLWKDQPLLTTDNRG
ncbi:MULTISPECIES: peptide-methionine (S)-S-oxide reductase MsrA [Rhizobium]|nr:MULTISPECIES: peptide-methionine (S)-S-oxide reductase MsrA [Rhizobium]